MASSCCFFVAQHCWTSSSSVVAGGHGFFAPPGEPLSRLPKLAAAKQVRSVIEGLPIEVFQASSDAQLQAACDLRVCTFNEFSQTYRIEEHCRFLSAMEFEVLKEKVEGKIPGFGKVTCVIATVPLKDADYKKDLISLCKITGVCGGIVDEQLVVGSLDLNKTPRLPDEMCGSHPKGLEGEHRRGYLSNVCVAKAIQRNGVGTRLIKHAEILALEQGISDLYTHVAVDNESARSLYTKCGFVLEKKERAAEARLMGRPSRFLLWMDLSRAL